MFNPAMLNAPIPGMSLTQEPGNMPWENPPELTTIGEVMDFILEKTFTVEVENLILELIKYMADSAGVEYVESYKDKEDEEVIPYRILKDVIKEIHEEQDTPKLDVPTSMPKDLEPKGLMSRLDKEN